VITFLNTIILQCKYGHGNKFACKLSSVVRGPELPAIIGKVGRESLHSTDVIYSENDNTIT